MDELKQSVQLAVHEQKDPLLIYKFEAFNLFKTMLEQVNRDVISFLFKGNLPSHNANSIQQARTSKQDQYIESKEDFGGGNKHNNKTNTPQRPAVTETIIRDQPKINRNDNVTIKHVMSGKSETMKYKKAEPLLAKGEWVLVNE